MLMAGLASHAGRVDPATRGSYQHFLLRPLIRVRKLALQATVPSDGAYAPTCGHDAGRGDIYAVAARGPFRLNVRSHMLRSRWSRGEDADVCDLVGLVRSIISLAGFGLQSGASRVIFV